jgi:hypothetical protein
VLERLPVRHDATVEALGRPAIGVGLESPTLFWSKPLADPFGGTTLANGRHPVKMHEPTAAADAPEEIVYLILGPLQFSETHLRVYGHPDLLAVASAVNGDDFVPFNEARVIDYGIDARRQAYCGCVSGPADARACSWRAGRRYVRSDGRGQRGGRTWLVCLAGNLDDASSAQTLVAHSHRQGRQAAGGSSRMTGG